MIFLSKIFTAKPNLFQIISHSENFQKEEEVEEEFIEVPDSDEENQIKEEKK